MLDIRAALTACEEHVPDETRAAILALGRQAVDDLLQVFADEDLRDDQSPAGHGYAPVHAAKLLGDIGDPRAIETLLLEYLEGQYETLLYNAAALALPKFGVDALQPALTYHDESPDWEDRVALCLILAELGIQDERVYERIVAAFPHDIELISGSFAAYGDQRALPILSDVIDRWAAGDEAASARDIIEVASSIEELGGTLTASQTQALSEARGIVHDAARMRQRDHLLSPDARDALEQIFDGTHRRTLWSARGFIAALASGPSLIPPSAWAPLLLEDRIESVDDLNHLMELYNSTLDTIERAPAQLCPRIEDEQGHNEFLQGYMEAVVKDPKWIQAGRGREEVGPIFLFSDRATDMSPEDLAAARRDVRVLLPRILETIHADLAFARDRSAREADTIRRGPKIGRNDPCPCGSGKKHKRCCGRPGKEAATEPPSPPQDERDPLVYSPLGTKVSRDGISVEVIIYRDQSEPGWVLEVNDHLGGSTIWDDRFDTEQEALDEAMRVIDDDGIESFANGHNAGHVDRIPP